MTLLKKVYFACAYYFAVSVFLVVSLLVNFICFIIGFIPGSASLKWPLRATLQFLFRRWAWFMGFIRVLVLRTPNKTKRRLEKGQVWVMNHPSILDASYLLKFIANGVCIYKREIGKNPLYGATAKLADFIPNIGGPDMVRLACGALAKGEDLIVFPEGTRSTYVNVDNFKPGFALIAKRANALINVLWMESPPDFMTRDVRFWKVPKLTARVTIEKIGEVDPAQFDSVEAIVAEVKSFYAGK
jgi:1-acyl-sn-glycerol-3-phosphate acyltransferase